jgi:hypothetical protein
MGWGLPPGGSEPAPVNGTALVPGNVTVYSAPARACDPFVAFAELHRANARG